MSCFLSSPTLVEYRTSPQQKAKSRQAAHDRKYGSPKLELLRQKCRYRAKEARGNNFSQGRQLFNDKTFIEKIVREELTELDLKLEDIILKEFLDEANNWFAEAFEEEDENYLTDVDNLSQIVFCPICQKNNLELIKTEMNTLTCQCGTRFNFTGTLNDFDKQIHQIVNSHGGNCDANLHFFTEPNNQDMFILNAFCDRCDFFHLFR